MDTYVYYDHGTEFEVKATSIEQAQLKAGEVLAFKYPRSLPTWLLPGFLTLKSKL